MTPRILGSRILAIAGLVSGAAREQREMLYQFKSNYVIDDSAYRGVFPRKPQRTLDDVLALLPTGF